jgi:hypothetical protein
VSGSLASLLVLSISRNRAEVSSQNLIYGKFPRMQEDFCEFLSEVSGVELATVVDRQFARA